MDKNERIDAIKEEIKGRLKSNTPIMKVSTGITLGIVGLAVGHALGRKSGFDSGYAEAFIDILDMIKDD